MTILISDIEANGFYNTVTKVHCIVSQDYDSLELFISPHDFCSGLGTVISYEDHRKLHEKASKTVYHNGLMYDYPVLNKVLGWPVPKLSKVDDTFIQSSLFNPDIPIPRGCSKGAHSLEAWGIRMNYEKGGVDSFSEYTLPMLEYCIRDVEITTKLYRKMQAIRDKHDWELSLKIEYTMASLQAEQERQGVVLDEEKAYDLVEVLCEEIAEIDDLILRNVPAKPKPEGMPIETPFKLDGDYYDRVIKWYGDELWKA